MQYTIINGPSAATLQNAFFKHCASGEDRADVCFRLVEQQYQDNPHISGFDIVVVINQLAREDDAGTSWCFEGCDQADTNGFHRVAGYYNLLTSRGWIAYT